MPGRVFVTYPTPELRTQRLSAGASYRLRDRFRHLVTSASGGPGSFFRGSPKSPEAQLHLIRAALDWLPAPAPPHSCSFRTRTWKAFLLDFFLGENGAGLGVEKLDGV